MRFDLIYADPAWQFKVRSEKGKSRSAEKHYAISALDHMKRIPVQDIAADNSILLMWATYPNLKEAFELGEAWGFEYKTVAFTWAKLNRKSEGFFMGTGYYTRANPEICLLFRRGSGLKRLSRSVRNLVVTPVREHSRKPDEMHGYIEALFGDVRYVELFARNSPAAAQYAWHSLGDEINHRDLVDSVRDLADEPDPLREFLYLRSCDVYRPAHSSYIGYVDIPRSELDKLTESK